VPIVLDYSAATMTAKLKFSIVGQESESIMDMNQPDHLEPLLEPLESLQRLLSRFDNRGVIIGGTAVSMLGRARFTDDVDAMFLLSIQDIPRLLEAAKEEGIEPRIGNAAEFAKKSRVMLMKHVLSDTNIDISLGVMPFEQEMVERSVVHQIDEALQIRLPTPEDLIIMKAIAHRSKDLEDIRTIAEKYPDLDVGRIEEWVKAFGEVLETPDLWDVVKPLLK
jgi:predicted nucleotidyltransferase